MGNENPFSLSGKNILITGASSGIGQAISVVASRMGANIVISGRNSSNLKSTLEMMQEGDHRMIVADLIKIDDIEKLAESVPSLDGIVHCAGMGLLLPAKMVTENDLDLVMRTNFYSAVLLQAFLLRKKKCNKFSSIVFISSKAVDFPQVGNSIYSASKGALMAYSKCLAIELAPRGIRVNCISPAMVKTNLILQNQVTVEQLQESENNYPLKRYGNPEDIANLAVYLLSDASSWMTNSNIDITGGCSSL